MKPLENIKYVDSGIVSARKYVYSEQVLELECCWVNLAENVDFFIKEKYVSCFLYLLLTILISLFSCDVFPYYMLNMPVEFMISSHQRIV